MNILLVLNDPPYGTERRYNGLRLAHSLRKNDPDGAITVFLMGDAVIGAQTNQTTPDGCHNMEQMLKRLLTGQGKVLLCGTCMDAQWVPAPTRSSFCSTVWRPA